MAIKTQSVKKKKITTKPKKTAATRDAEKATERRKKRKADKPRSARVVTVRGIPYKLRKFESLNPRAAPETYYTRKGMTLREMIRGTPRMFINNAVDVEAHRYKQKTTKTGKPVIHGIMWTNDPFRPHKIRRYHETYLVGLDENQSKPVNKHRKVLAQCTCLTGDTKVLTEQGWKTIFELAQPFAPNYFPINYNIKGEMFAGSAPFYTGLKPVYKLTLSNGQSITATDNHQFLRHDSLGNRKFLETWTEVKDLNVGDALLMNDFAQPKIERGPEYWEAFFIGVMQGDGTLFASGRPNLKLFGNKKTIFKKLVDIAVVKGVSDIKGRENGINVQLNHRAIELCARYKFDNKRSVELKTLEQTLGYLSGLIATDGTTYKNGEILIRGGKDYLEQLVWKLMEFGYTQTTFYREREAGVATSQADKDHPVCVSTKEMWALRISQQADIVKNLAMSDYHRDRMQRGDPRPRKSWVKIVDITYAGKQHVYDITVPGPHRFAANGLIAHNCEAYVYNFEYANCRRGAAYMIYCNGEPPVWTNPGLAPGLCKHLIALAKIAIEENI